MSGADEAVDLTAEEISALKSAVSKLKADPTVCYEPSLSFFKDFLQSWGGKVPDSGSKKGPEPAAGKPDHTKPQKIDPEPQAPAEESAESEDEPPEPESDDPDRLPEDPEPFPPMAPEGKDELTDAEMDAQAAAKQAGIEAVEDGDLAKAVEKYSEAIQIGNASALMYAKRAEFLLKLKRPRACIQDCTAAIAINPDSGKAFRIRGKAHRRLGNWEEAHKDLAMGQKLDYDDDTKDVQDYVSKKWRKISDRNNRIRIKQETRAKKEKEKEMKRRKEEAKRAYEEAKKAEASGGMGGFPGGMGGMPGGFPGGMGGHPGMGGMDPNLMAGLMSDPELMKAFSNPKIMAAMQDIMSNPGNVSKYQSDPEIMALMQKVMSSMGGSMGGMGGMGGAGMGGAAGAAGAGSPHSGPTGGPTVEEVNEDHSGVDSVD